MVRIATRTCSIVISGLGLGLLAACAAPIETRPVSATLAPAPLPERQVGETFTYLNEAGEEVDSTVAAVDGARVSWQSSDGSQWTAVTPLFGNSSTAWKIPDSEGQQEYASDPAALFPIEVGKTVTVSYEGINNGESFSGRQRCTAQDQAQVDVPAGSYDTFVVVCQRGRDLSSPFQTRTYYYAPEVGAPVFQVIEEQRRRTRTSKLVRHASSSS